MNPDLRNNVAKKSWHASAQGRPGVLWDSVEDRRGLAHQVPARAISATTIATA